jgi:predicted lipoprotein with Yx(FWY)xxD motif
VTETKETAVTFRRRLVLIGLAGVAALGLTGAAMATGEMTKHPVIKLTAKGFGNVLATPKHQALYYWNVEKKDLKVHCTGSCAKLWPPLVVKSAATVPKRIEGIKGTFGTVTRPDGKIQVTHNRLPVYTYAHEGPDQVLCDNVNGWFVVRV